MSLNIVSTWEPFFLFSTHDSMTVNFSTMLIVMNEKMFDAREDNGFNNFS